MAVVTTLKERGSDFTRMGDGLPTVKHQTNFRKNTALRQYIKEAHKGHLPGSVGERLYRSGLSRPKGFHDYNNLQWDPRIYRGRTSINFREKNLPPFTTILDFRNYLNPPHVQDGKSPSKKVIIPTRYKIGGIFRPTDDDIVVEEASGNPCHVFDKTITEMEPFIIEEVTIPEYKERDTQWDATKFATVRKCSTMAGGPSKSLQVSLSCAEEGNKDPIEPLIKNTGKKILEQSVLEAMEEDELQQIRTEIAGFVDIQRMRQYREAKIVEMEQFRMDRAETERVVRTRQREVEAAAEEIVCAGVYSVVTCTHLLINTLADLRQQNFLSMVNKHIDDVLHSWLNQQIHHRGLFVPNRLVDELIRHAESTRTTGVSDIPPVVAAPPYQTHDLTMYDAAVALEGHTVGETELEFEAEMQHTRRNLTSSRGVRFSM